jgi:hypothetical protein
MNLALAISRMTGDRQVEAISNAFCGGTTLGADTPSYFAGQAASNGFRKADRRDCVGLQGR